MADHSLDITLTGLSLPSVPGEDRLLQATVLYHPDSNRVGEVAAVPLQRDSTVLPLGRNEHNFSPPGSHTARPLADPYLSRRPLQLRLEAGTAVIAPGGFVGRAWLGERVLTGDTAVSLDLLSAGLPLLLGRRVALWLRLAAAPVSAPGEHELLGVSAALGEVREQLARVADEESPVLLLGETGTGKELAAQGLHRASRRAAVPMVTVNMAAIPAELAASELFGVRRGAFTGAATDRAGYFRRAQGSSLFLDEVGACPVAVQPQLLRALQQGEIQVPGGAPEQVDVRVIAATDAWEHAPGAEFSQALRHRLSGFEVRLPPLRERIEDLGVLLRHCLDDALPDPGNDLAVTRWAGVVHRFAAYHWPGNVRQLFNFARQVQINSVGRTDLALPANVLRELQTAPPTPSFDGRPPGRLDELDDGRIHEEMLRARWEVAEAARQLQVSRQSLYKRIRSIPGLRLVDEVPVAEVEAVYHESGGDLERAAERLQVSRPALQRRWKALALLPRDY